MDILEFFKKNKFTISIFFLIILSIFYSVNTHLYVYDGHHHGLMFSNAKDLLEGKVPYKDIFIQYGFLTTIFHAFSIKLFGDFILSINILTILAYSFGVFFLSLTVAKYTNYFYSLICIILLLSHHPIAWLPWSNYLAFFFLTAAIYVLHIQNSNYQFFAGILLAFACLSRENYIIFIFLSLFLISICVLLIKFKNKKNLYKKLFFIFAGFFLPIICFFFYLIFNKIFFYWKDYLILPSLYLENYDIGIHTLIANYIIFFLTNSFYNFINQPQYLIISIILISNTILLLHQLIFSKDKSFNLILILFLSIFSSVVSIGIELFRLYTSVIIGIIPFFYLISLIKDIDYKKICLTTLFFLSLFCIIFYPTGNYKIFKNINKNESKTLTQIPYFKFQKWEKYKIDPLYQIDNIQKKVIKNCNIQYFANLTFDTFYTNLFDLENIIIFPGIRSKSLENDAVFNHFNKSRNMLKKINEETAKKNLILLISENNYYIGKNKINIDHPYANKEINLNKVSEKPQILRIYYPENCLN